jgi:hypothetical protein
MSIDTAAILAARYHTNPAPLKAAVLGQGGADINPYAALRALQLQKEAERYKMAEAAMNGQQQQPSLVQQALQGAQMPQQQPQQPQPQQGLMAMNQQQPSPGLGGMPAPEGEYAGGGIVAFAGENESLVKNTEDQLDPSLLQDLEDSELDNSMGDETSYKSVSAMLPGLMRNIQNTRYAPMPDAAYKTAFEDRLRLLQKDAGTDPIPGMQQQIEQFDAERQQGLDQAKGLAMLAAAGDALQPGGFARAAGASAKTFATEYGKAMAASKAEQRSLMSMKFNLADAQRKEKMGLNREAIHAADQARADHTASQRFGLEKNKALATVATGMARATRPGANTGAPKGFDNLAAKYFEADKLANNKLPENERAPEALVEARSYQRAAADWAKVPAGETVGLKKQEIDIKGSEAKTRESEANIKLQEAITHWQRAETERKKAIAEEKKKLRTDRTYITANPEEKAARNKAIEDSYPSVPKPTAGGAGAASSEPAAPDTSKTSAKAPAGNKNSSKTGKAATIKGAPAGSKFGKLLPDGRYEILDSQGKLIGHAK